MKAFETEHTESTHRFADFLTRSAQSIIMHWQCGVRSDGDVPSSGHLNDSELADHLPDILADVIALLRDPLSTLSEESLESNSETHGRGRWAQKFSLEEVMTEIDRFRKALLIETLDDFKAENPTVTSLAIRSIEHKLYGYMRELIMGSIREFTLAKDAQLTAKGNELKEANRMLDAANSSLRREGRRIKRLSLTDALTAVGNRRHLIQRLKAEIASSRILKVTLALVMLDLDHFKQVNDTYGHHVGDQVLRAVAKVLGEACRETDTLARYGGEEFVIILPRTSQSSALKILERVRRELRDISIPSLRKAVTASYGLAVWNPDDDAESLLKRADDAVYLAKNSGRDRVCTTDSES